MQEERRKTNNELESKVDELTVELREMKKQLEPVIEVWLALSGMVAVLKWIGFIIKWIGISIAAVVGYLAIKKSGG